MAAHPCLRLRGQWHQHRHHVVINICYDRLNLASNIVGGREKAKLAMGVRGQVRKRRLV